MSLDFDKYELGDLCNISSSKRIFAREYVDSGIPFYRGKEIIELFNNKEVSNELFITNEKYFSIKEKYGVPEKGDILLSSVGTLGVPYLVKNEKFYFKDGNLTWFKDFDSKLNNKFLYWWLQSPEAKFQINNKCIGSTQKALPIKTLEKFDINLPPITKQIQIINILENISNKIKINISINKNLYAIIEARFKYYVKDFSNLEKVILSDYCHEIIRGFNSKYVEKSNLINLNQKVNKGDILEKQYFKYLNEDIEVPKEKFAKKKDVLLNSLGDGTLGRVHYYNDDTDNVVIDQHITIIRADENKLPSSYIYQYLKCGAGQYHLDSLISGSTGMLMLNISHIRKLEIPILPHNELLEFDNFAKDLFNKISTNTKEIEKLTKLRDTLLPKLMSGEIDVSKINCDLKYEWICQVCCSVRLAFVLYQQKKLDQSYFHINYLLC